MTESSDRTVTNQTEINQADKQLIERTLHGDNRAFAIIIKQTEKLVTQIVFQMIDNAEDRKDLAQDIYLKAFKKLPGFRFESKLSTWIAQIGYNTCLDYLRKKNRGYITTAIDIVGSDEEVIASNPDERLVSSTRVDHLLSQKFVSGILKKAIEKLPPTYKTLIILFHQEELSYEEMGQITGLPAGTIKNYLFRARRSLKEILLADYKKEDIWL